MHFLIYRSQIQTSLYLIFWTNFNFKTLFFLLLKSNGLKPFPHTKI